MRICHYVPLDLEHARKFGVEKKRKYTNYYNKTHTQTFTYQVATHINTLFV